MMTSFNSSRLFTTFCLFLFSLQLSRRSSVFVEAETRSFIENLCGQTLEVDACKNWVSWNPTYDIPELIYSVLFCMYTQADSGYKHADELLRTDTSEGVKHALQVCTVTLFAALNDLSDALSTVEGSEYKEAFVNMKNSRRSLIWCTYAFQKFATGDHDAIPTLLMNDMVLMKRLFDVGHYFFHLIIKINDR